MENWPQTPQNPVDNNAWFNDQNTPLPTPPKKSNKRLIMLVGIIVILGLLVIAISAVSSANQRTACLTADDYATLTGTTLTDSISPTTNFYATAIAFQPNSTNYSTASDADVHGEQLLQKVAELYKSQGKTSIKITVGGSYFAEGASELAQKRATTVQASLVALGIAASDIQAVTPTYTEPEDESGVAQDSTTTTISIVSDQTCIEEPQI